MADRASIGRAARARIRDAADEIRHSLDSIDRGRPGDAEPDETRKSAVLQARRNIPAAAARELARHVGPEATWGRTIDFIDVAFFERGVVAARSVCRIAIGGGGFGTGFLISPRLLITNNHVLESASVAREANIEFDYELDVDGNPRTTTRFSLAPQDTFITSDRDDFDYTVVAVGPRVGGSKDLGSFGYLPLSAARNKHSLGEFVNIVQHPEARMKQAVVRDNQLVSRPKGGTVLHYVADTEPGSSGSPVFNVLWEVVALHHWGGPHRETIDERGTRVPMTVNEGIRISAIVTDLETRSARLSARARGWISEALKLGVESASRPGSRVPLQPSAAANDNISMALSADGTATWQIPLTVSVRLGTQLSAASAKAPQADPLEIAGTSYVSETPAAPEARFTPDANYDNRSGYDPEFLKGEPIALPVLSAKQKKQAAKNKQRAVGDDAYELKYEHFSVVMNGKRRLAFFTATNIDGAKSKDVDRKTGVIDDPFEGAEASEPWYEDPRIEAHEQTPADFYANQTAFDAAGDPIKNKRLREHLNRIFQQGHLTRRQDPTWGSKTAVLRANADTFHVTNRAPQVGYFNMGVRKPGAEVKAGHPGGELHWRALEDWVLNNARVDRTRVTVFCGPVLDDKHDIKWDRGRAGLEGFKAPLKYWKLVARVEDRELKATALVADQEPLIDAAPEVLALGAEEVRRVSFEKVRKYQVSVEALERLTGLRFGAALKAADTFDPKGRNTSERELSSFDEFSLEPRARPARAKRRRKPARAARQAAKRASRR